MTYKLTIAIEAQSAEEAQRIGQLMQHTVNVVDNRSLEKLLSKVRCNPSIVQTALKFV